MYTLAYGMPYGPFCNPRTLQEFLEDGGKKMLYACIRENGRGLNREELMHELIITAARSIQKYDDRHVETQMSTYIWGACENAIKMVRRAKNSKKEQAAAAVASLEEMDWEVPYQDNFEDLLIERLERERRALILYKCIEDPAVLNDMERCATLMSLNGYNQNDIKVILGCSQSTVSKTLSAAKQKLKPALETAGIRG